MNNILIGSWFSIWVFALIGYAISTNNERATLIFRSMLWGLALLLAFSQILIFIAEHLHYI